MLTVPDIKDVLDYVRFVVWIPMDNMNSTRDYIRNVLDTIRYDFGDLMVANIFWVLLLLPIITILIEPIPLDSGFPCVSNLILIFGERECPKSPRRFHSLSGEIFNSLFIEKVIIEFDKFFEN